MSTRRSRAWVAGGFASVLVATVLGVALGAVSLPPQRVFLELVNHIPGVHVRSGLSEREAAIVWRIRFPRVVLGLLVGAMLSVSGAAYQGAFRNPLVDPYLLGSAAGAGLGATLAIVAGASGAPLPIAAFVGALAAVALTYVLGASADRGRSTASLVLAGVAITSFLTAVQAYLLQKKSDTLREVYTWILGRLTVARWTEVLLVLPYFVISAAVLLS